MDIEEMAASYVHSTTESTKGPSEAIIRLCHLESPKFNVVPSTQLKCSSSKLLLVYPCAVTMLSMEGWQVLKLCFRYWSYIVCLEYILIANPCS